MSDTYLNLHKCLNYSITCITEKKKKKRELIDIFGGWRGYYGSPTLGNKYL